MVADSLGSCVIAEITRASGGGQIPRGFPFFGEIKEIAADREIRAF
jgi:hypothetical protein